MVRDGRHGAGKSTLLKLVAGQTSPDAGTVSIGASVASATSPSTPWTSSTRASPWLGVLERDTQGLGRLPSDGARRLRLQRRRRREALPRAQRRREGARRPRLHALRSPNFLVLDEPTNHLDIDTKEMLLRALCDFEGTMLFVSHDVSSCAPSPTVSSSCHPRARTRTTEATPST